MTYKDKHGNVIREGMTIKHDSGDTQKVYSNLDNDDLGVNASNEKYLENNPEARREIYLLSNFDLREWEIVGEEV